MSESSQSLSEATAAVAALYSDSNGAPRDERPQVAAEEDSAHAHDEDDASDSSETSEEGASDTDHDGEADHSDSDEDSDGAPRDADEKEAKRERMRAEDYTRKTQELAKERREFEAEAASLRDKQAQVYQLLEVLNTQMQQVQVQEPDWNYLRHTNPQEYTLRRVEWMHMQQAQEQIAKEQAALRHEEQVAQAHALRAQVASEQAALFAKHPEFKDPKVWAKAKKEIIAYGRDVEGFPEEELKMATDHRAISTMYKAMKAHRALSKEGEPVLSSGRRVGEGAGSAPRKPTRYEAASERLTKTGSMSDAREAMALLLKNS